MKDEQISKALKEHSIHTKDQVSFLAGLEFYRKNNPVIKKIRDIIEEYKTKLDESPTAFGREEFLIVELNKILNQ